MKDPKTENFLNDGSYKWKYLPKVMLNEIDMKASLENPARLHHAIDENVAEGYMLAMGAVGSDRFPAIVLLTQDPQASVLPYLIATGCHRVYAANMADITAFDAYVVTEADAYRRISLVRRLNILEGYGVTQKDRIAQALQMQAEWPDRALSELASDWHIKLETLKTASSAQKAVDRGRRFGYSLDDGKLKLTQKGIVTLGHIHSEKVFDRAARYATMNAPTTNEIHDLCRDIKKTRDETAAMALVDRAEMVAAEKRIQARARHAPQRPAAASQFFGTTRSLNNQADKGLERLHLAAYPDRKMARSLCEQTIELMKRVLAALDHIDRVEKPGQQPGAQQPVMH